MSQKNASKSVPLIVLFGVYLQMSVAFINRVMGVWTMHATWTLP